MSRYVRAAVVGFLWAMVLDAVGVRGLDWWMAVVAGNALWLVIISARSVGA